MTPRLVKLEEVATVFGGNGFPHRYQGLAQGEFPFAKVGDVSRALLKNADEIEEANNYVSMSQVKEMSARIFPSKTIFMAKIGEAIRLNRRAISACPMLVDNNVVGITADEAKIDPYFLLYFLRTVDGIQLSSKTVVPSIRKSTLMDLDVPCPSLMEQHRIVFRIKECMQRVDEIERLRRASLEESAKLLRAYYHDLYKSLVSKNNTVFLGDVCRAIGGGTPSKKRKDFWGGDILWVSPKEMKIRDITDTSLKITEEAVIGSSVKLISEPAVLFVVRGMILAHTIPVAINRVPVTLNQDMKAVIPKDDIDIDFLATMIRGAEREILRAIEVAGHGTRRLKTEHWMRLPIPKISWTEQREIVEKTKAMEAASEALQDHISMEKIRLMRGSILHKAFSGEL
jgi:type I restriction enzyme S subunit